MRLIAATRPSCAGLLSRRFLLGSCLKSYGDITPATFAGQYFLTVYVLVATTVTMDILGSAVHL